MSYKKAGLLITLLSLVALANPLSAQHSFGLSDDVSNKTGFLKLSVVNQDSFYVVINNQFEDVLRIASGDSIEVKAEPIHLRFVKQYYMDVIQHVDIKENNVHKISTRFLQVRGEVVRSRRSSYPRIHWENNNFILSDPQTEIYVDDRFLGTHYAVLDTTGTFKVQLRHPTGSERVAKFVSAIDKPINFHQQYIKPSRSTARYLSFVPGGSQFYKKQTFKALAFTAATIGGAALALNYESRYQEQMSEFEDLNSQYFSANNAEDAFLLGNRAEAAYAEAEDLSKTRNRLIYGTALVYIANIVDGFLAPSIGYRDDSRKIDPYLDFDPMYRQPVFTLSRGF